MRLSRPRLPISEYCRGVTLAAGSADQEARGKTPNKTRRRCDSAHARVEKIDQKEVRLRGKIVNDEITFAV